MGDTESRVENDPRSAQAREPDGDTASGPRTREWRILAVVLVRSLVAVLDTTIVNLALPSLASLGAASDSYRFSTRSGRKAVQAGIAVMFAGLALMLLVLHLSAPRRSRRTHDRANQHGRKTGTMIWRKLGHGIAAGAAGVTMLNAITYLDMAIRARPSSDTPSQAVERLARKAGARIPGQGDDHDNRLAGLGPLAGIMTGAVVGVAAAFARPMLAGIPAPAAALVLGAMAMAGADGPLVALGLTRPGDWAAADWASDIVPHLGYGAAAYATLTALDNRARAQ